MREAGKAHAQRRLQARGHVQHHHQVHAGIDFGVVVGALGHAPEAVHLGQHHLERAALAQHLEHARGLFLHEATRQLLPHALGHQVVGLAVRHHGAHQRHRFRRHRKVGEARRKARHAQDAHRVVVEGVGHVAQHLVAQVARAAMGVKNGLSARGVCVKCYRIDSEIAP